MPKVTAVITSAPFTVPVNKKPTNQTQASIAKVYSQIFGDIQERLRGVVTG